MNDPHPDPESYAYSETGERPVARRRYCSMIILSLGFVVEV